MEENKMGVMPVNKLLISMALPMMISMLVQALYNIVDSMFVAQISENALTAVSLAFPAQNLMIAVGTGTGVGINALVSRSLGERNGERANLIANNGLLLYVLSGIVFALFGIFGSRLFFRAQTSDLEIVELGTQYLRICCLLSTAIFLQFGFERILQATGRTIYTMLTQGLGAIVNIILDPILIFGLFGAPKLGVSGAAVATVFGQICAASLACFFNKKKNDDIVINPKKYHLQAHAVKSIYAIGVPSICMASIGSIMTFGMNKILIRLHLNRSGGIRGIFQAAKLHLHACIRPEQRHGANHRLQLRRKKARPSDENHAPCGDLCRFHYDYRHDSFLDLHTAAFGNLQCLCANAFHRGSRPAYHQPFLPSGRL